jgi:hypothetical protein
MYVFDAHVLKMAEGTTVLLLTTCFCDDNSSKGFFNENLTKKKRYQSAQTMWNLLTLLARVVQQLTIWYKGVEERERERESWGNGALCIMMIIITQQNCNYWVIYTTQMKAPKKTKNQLQKNT